MSSPNNNDDNSSGGGSNNNNNNDDVMITSDVISKQEIMSQGSVSQEPTTVPPNENNNVNIIMDEKSAGTFPTPANNSDKEKKIDDDNDDDSDMFESNQGDQDDDQNDVIAFNEDESPQKEQPPKRRKLNDHGHQQIGSSWSSSDTNQQSTTVTPKLSKWTMSKFLNGAARPKSKIELARIIPLNDEFLSAFGKREKSFDDKLGRELEKVGMDQDEESAEEGIMEPDHNTASVAFQSKQSQSKNDDAVSLCKVKFANLNYETSAVTLQEKCEAYGEVIETKMILDKDSQGGTVVLNTGRAYVTFANPASAQACIDHLKEIDGRQVRLKLAKETPQKDSSKKQQSANSILNHASALTQSVDINLSIKCFRCQQVGHMEADCPNEAKPRPCPLCAKCDHDIRSCPLSRVCFNCGIPGHIGRDCTFARNSLPKRLICGICFRPGHHRLACRGAAPGRAECRDAICMICFQPGHFMCREIKWYFGLQGISCFNCGRQGHSGYDCNGPTLFTCSQNSELATAEIERAEADSIADQIEKEREKRRRQNAPQRRGGSVPPPPKRQNFNDSDRRQSSGGSGRRRNSSGDRGRGYDTNNNNKSNNSRGYNVGGGGYNGNNRARSQGRGYR